VGVELAAEVAVFFPSTKVVLVHSGQRLVGDFAHPVADHSLAWLRKHSVEVLLGHRCEEMHDADALGMDAPAALRSDRALPCASSLLVRGAEHPEGLRIDADLVFWCRGGPPSSDAADLPRTMQVLRRAQRRRASMMIGVGREVKAAVPFPSRWMAQSV
jgi:NADH dehydrogenase FAD-containing subunit